MYRVKNTYYIVCSYTCDRKIAPSFTTSTSTVLIMRACCVPCFSQAKLDSMAERLVEREKKFDATQKKELEAKDKSAVDNQVRNLS